MSAGYDGSLKFDTCMNTKGFNAGISAISKSLKGLAAAVGIAFGVKAIVSFGKAAISLASDLEEVQNVVDVSFGDMKYKIEEFAETSIEKFGLSELAAKKTASSFAAMAKGMKFSQKESADMAIELTKLSADMASFYNITQDESRTALSSVYTGETETLKRYGILITEVNLQEYARQQGIDKSIAKMTQQEKIMLRYNYVMEATSLAQGDFARTSDSWANQVRVLSERWKQFMSIMGDSLITILTPVLKVLNSIVSTLISFAKTINGVVSALFGKQTSQNEEIAASGNAAAGAVGGLADSTEEAGDAAEKAGKKAKNALASFDELNVLAQGSGNGEGDTPGFGGSGVDMETFAGEIGQDVEVSPKLLSSVDRLKSLLQSLRDYAVINFKSNVDEAVKKISEQLGKLKTTFKKMWSDIKTLSKPFEDFLKGDFTTLVKTAIDTAGLIISGLLDSFNMVLSDVWEIVIFPWAEKLITVGLPMIAQFKTQVLLTLQTLFTEVKSIFDMLWKEAAAPALQVFMTIWGDMVDTLYAKWQEYGEPIFDSIRQAIEVASDLLKQTWETIVKPVFDALMGSISWLWEKHLSPLLDNFLDLVATAISCVLKIYNEFIAPLVKAFTEEFGPPIREALTLVIDVIGSIAGTVADVFGGVMTTLKGIIQFITGVFTGDWDMAWQGVVDSFEGIFDAIEGILKGVINIVIDLVNTMIRVVVSGVNKIIEQVNKLSFDLPEIMGGAHIGFNFDMFQPYQIPKLATGAVLPANQPFLAMLGDQKSGRNLEAPEGLIRQIMQEELAGLMGSGEFTVEMPVYLDGELIYKNQKKVAKRHGGSLITGGVF